MSETRRELFTTTVMGALGVTAVAGAVIGYEAKTLLAPQAPAPPYAGSVVAVHDGSVSLWYFFHFESDRSNCRLYSVTGTPTIADMGSVDTTSWFVVSKKKSITTGTTKISYTTTGGTTATTDISFDANGYLDPGSLTWLLNNLPGGVPPQVAGSWNEIGKQ
jgi:hypothetical protein